MEGMEVIVQSFSYKIKVTIIDPVTIANTRKLKRRRLRNYCYYMRVQQTGTSEVAASSGLIQSTSSKSETKLVETRSNVWRACAAARFSTPLTANYLTSIDLN